MQLRELTRNEKELVAGNGKYAKDYLFYKDINDSYFQVKHKETGRIVTIDKYRRGKRYESEGY